MNRSGCWHKRSVGCFAIGLIVCAAVTAGEQAVGAARVQSAPAFSDADTLRVVRDVCGANGPGSATDRISTPIEVQGFVSTTGSTLFVELLSEGFLERGVARHVVVFGAHFVEDGEIDSSQGAQTTVCAAVLERQRDGWVATHQTDELAKTGFNGRDPVVTIEAIGSDRHALRIAETSWSAGSAMEVVTLYDSVTFEQLLSVATAADDCGGDKPCFRFEGELTHDAAVTPSGTHDLLLKLKGSYRDEAGKVVPIPKEPLVLRLTSGAYAPLSQTAAMRALWQAVQSPW